MKLLSGLLLCLIFGCLHQAVADPPVSQQWNFKVFLDDKEIGHHSFSLQKSADLTRITSTARFDVKILFINAYQYEHDDQEIWREDCLTGMKARTNDNGKLLSVNAIEQADGIKVVTEKQQLDLSGCVMSFAYWNPAMLRQTRLLNAQTGEYELVTIQPLSTTTLRAVGKEWQARQYRLTGRKLQIDLWYSLDGRWLALESTTENGRRLRYVLS